MHQTVTEPECIGLAWQVLSSSLPWTIVDVLKMIVDSDILQVQINDTNRKNTSTIFTELTINKQRQCWDECHRLLCIYPVIVTWQLHGQAFPGWSFTDLLLQMVEWREVTVILTVVVFLGMILDKSLASAVLKYLCFDRPHTFFLLEDCWQMTP